MINGRFEMVPAPTKAPEQKEAGQLGLATGIRVEQSHHQWRCACCLQMQRPNSLAAWLPDSVQQGDPAWSVTEACRQNAYNGSFSAWCIPCAKTIK